MHAINIVQKKQNSVNVYNAKIDKCLNNRNSKFCKELQNFSEKYSCDNSHEVYPEVPSLFPFP